MQSGIFVPDSLRTAGREVRLALGGVMEQLSREDFLRAWCSVIYLFPGLHPDEFLESDRGGPRTLKRFAAEARRRFEAGELADDELYCYETALTRLERECEKLERAKPWLFQDYFVA
jgi:hypothetical protein